MLNMYERLDFLFKRILAYLVCLCCVVFNCNYCMLYENKWYFRWEDWKGK